VNRRHETLGRRLWALVPAPLAQPPSQRLPRPVRRLFGRVQSVVREALDLPSRTELSEAMVRLEDVSRRLDTLAATEIRDLGDQVSDIEVHQVADHNALAAERAEIHKLRMILERELSRAGSLVADANLAESAEAAVVESAAAERVVAATGVAAPATDAKNADGDQPRSKKQRKADREATFDDKKARKKAKKAEKKAGKVAKKDKAEKKAGKKAEKKASKVAKKDKADTSDKTTSQKTSSGKKAKADRDAKAPVDAAQAPPDTANLEAATERPAKKSKKKPVINVGSPKAMKERKRSRKASGK